MRKPVKRFAALLAGCLVVTLAVIVPTGVSSALAPAPDSQYCAAYKKFAPAISSASNDVANAPSQAEQMKQLANFAAVVNSSFQSMLDEGNPPAEIASQLQEQVGFWAELHDVVVRYNAGDSKATTQLTTWSSEGGRMETEMGNLQKVFDDTKAYCTADTASTQASAVTAPPSPVHAAKPLPAVCPVYAGYKPSFDQAIIDFATKGRSVQQQLDLAKSLLPQIADVIAANPPANILDIATYLQDFLTRVVAALEPLSYAAALKIEAESSQAQAQFEVMDQALTDLCSQPVETTATPTPSATVAQTSAATSTSAVPTAQSSATTSVAPSGAYCQAFAQVLPQLEAFNPDAVSGMSLEEVGPMAEAFNQALSDLVAQGPPEAVLGPATYLRDVAAKFSYAISSGDNTGIKELLTQEDEVNAQLAAFQAASEQACPELVTVPASSFLASSAVVSVATSPSPAASVKASSAAPSNTRPAVSLPATSAAPSTPATTSPAASPSPSVAPSQSASPSKSVAAASSAAESKSSSAVASKSAPASTSVAPSSANAPASSVVASPSKDSSSSPAATSPKPSSASSPSSAPSSWVASSAQQASPAASSTGTKSSTVPSSAAGSPSASTPASGFCAAVEPALQHMLESDGMGADNLPSLEEVKKAVQALADDYDAVLASGPPQTLLEPVTYLQNYFHTLDTLLAAGAVKEAQDFNTEEVQAEVAAAFNALRVGAVAECPDLKLPTDSASSPAASQAASGSSPAASPSVPSAPAFCPVYTTMSPNLDALDKLLSGGPMPGMADLTALVTALNEGLAQVLAGAPPAAVADPATVLQGFGQQVAQGLATDPFSLQSLMTPENLASLKATLTQFRGATETACASPSQPASKSASSVASSQSVSPSTAKATDQASSHAASTVPSASSAAGSSRAPSTASTSVPGASTPVAPSSAVVPSSPVVSSSAAAPSSPAVSRSSVASSPGVVSSTPASSAQVWSATPSGQASILPSATTPPASGYCVVWDDLSPDWNAAKQTLGGDTLPGFDQLAAMATALSEGLGRLLAASPPASALSPATSLKGFADQVVQGLATNPMSLSSLMSQESLDQLTANMDALSAAMAQACAASSSPVGSSPVSSNDSASSVVGSQSSTRQGQSPSVLDMEPSDAASAPISAPQPTTSVARSAQPTVAPVAANGRVLTVNGQGFLPGDLVTATMFSDPYVIGSKTADAMGNVSFTWTLPAGTAAGTHTVVLAGAQSGSAQQTFQVAADGSLAKTGSQASERGVLIGLLCLAVGLGLTTVARQRRQATRS